MIARRCPARGPLLLLLLAACSGTEASQAPAASGGSGQPSRTPVSTESPAVDSPSVEPGEVPIAEVPPPLALEDVASGLQSPVSIAATPDGWLYVNERGGRVVAVDPASGTTQVSLDITDRVGFGGSEQGLLGLAFHPAWPDEQRAFVDYTDRAGNTVLSEFTVTDEPLPARIDPRTERTLLQVEQPYQNHNGGQLAFGADGYLYMALGDGGSGGDPHGNGQNPSTLLGSILRIDVDSGDGYAIPDDNPFADGEAGAPEVFLYGLRNPWRFSFDRATNLLWIGDVGQNATEEVDRVDTAADAGANLGWNVMEASHCFVAPACSAEGLTLPVAEYGHAEGCSVTGGYVYRGDAIGDLSGWYLFSDYCSGMLFGIPSDAEGVIAPRELLETGTQVSAFGEDADGELYLADLEGGTLYRIVSAR